MFGRQQLFRSFSRFTPLYLNATIRHNLARPIRSFSSTGEAKKGGGSNLVPILGVAALSALAAYYFYTPAPARAEKVQAPQKIDYNAVYKDIAALLEKDPEYDDGNYGPILLRLAWHASGTYNVHDGSGGSDGATMRFEPESAHDANAGLGVARNFLEDVKKKYPQISYSDLWSLAGVVAVQEMGGPTIPWRPGRTDKLSSQECAPDGRLPDASKSSGHLRDIFYRMGLNDQEIVALSGAHALGRCHTDRSGFDGPWTFSPTVFTNDYFKLLLSEKWVVRKWKGPKQYADKKTGNLMMLETDIALIQDDKFKKWVEIYAKDEKRFFEDFAKAFKKLQELGVSPSKLGNDLLLSA